MPDEMFTQLPTVANAAMSDIICAVQGYVGANDPGLSVQETLQQVFNLFKSNVILYNAGNPNGFVAGTTYQLCWDTTNGILYVCTTSGTAVTAVWSKSVTLTAGSGITIVQNSNNIVISASDIGLSWNNVTTTTTTMVIGNAYVTNNTSRVILTLPETSSFGDIILIVGQGSGGWKVVYGAAQYIQLGEDASTPTTGNIASTNPYDAISLVCVIANTTWQNFAAPQGNITIV